MHARTLISALSAFALSGLLATTANAVAIKHSNLEVIKPELKEITPVRKGPRKGPPSLKVLPRHDLTARSDRSGLNLRDDEHFMWGHSQNLPLVNMSTTFQGEHEKIISMDRFIGMLDNVDCTNPNLKLDFTNKGDFEQAKKSWSWVNNHRLHHFIMVANYPGCTPNGEAHPFQVTAAKYNLESYTVYLTAEQIEWKDALPEWEIHANSLGLAQAHQDGLVRRVDETATLDVSHDFSQNIVSTTVSGVDLGLDCSPCGTGGTLNFDFSASFSIIHGFSCSVSVTPSGVEASATLALRASGTLTAGFETTVPVVSVELPGGLNIAGVIELGPNLDIQVGASMDAWSGQATVGYGATVNIPDDSSMTLDFTGSDSSFNGWVPTFTPSGPTLDASISGHAEVFASANIDLDLTVLGKGLVAGVGLKLPDLTADLTVEASNTGVCGNGIAGVSIDVELGMDLGASAGFKGSDPAISTDFFSTATPLFSTCTAVGGDAVATTSTPPPPPAVSTPAAINNSTIPAAYRRAAPITKHQAAHTPAVLPYTSFTA